MNHRHAFRVRGAALAFAFGLSAGGAPAAHAQFTEPPAPTAYALRDVTIVRPDGTTEAGQTLIVRAGRIEALARGAAVPADARVISGDSLYVYPGLIDAAGAIEFELPRDSTERSRIRSWNPPRTIQGYMPSRRVLDYVTATGEDAADLRRKGIVAVAAHPPLTDPLMPGRGVFVLLRPDAAAPHELVVQPVLAPLMTLRGGRGVYPSTGMGVMAWYRQTFLDAQRQTLIANADHGAGADPLSGFDADMDIVQNVLRTRGRIFFVANEADDIRHVLTLASEFGFEPVIVGGSEAWQVADALKAAEVPVLVSVDFPKPRRWKPDEKPKEGEEPKALAPAAAREKAELEAAYANAGRLARAGVTFALVSGGRGDLREGVQKTIEHGLLAADALRALTVTPATLLGVPGITRVQAGSPATFVVTDAPLFTKDARVLYTFVEGVLEKGADARSRAAADTSAASAGEVTAAGTWTVDVLAPETMTFTMKLTQDGTAITGTMDTPEGSFPLSGTLQGTTLSLTGSVTIGGSSIRIEMNGVIRGDEAVGRVDSPMGAVDWKARRTEPGART